MDGLKQLGEGIRRRLGTLSFNQKILLGALLVAGMISVSVFTLWLQQDEQAVLFTNLSPEDASVALQELAKQDVPAELSNGGTTIMVPASQVHRLRVDLAAKGVPSSGTVGFEIFDGKQYGLTEFLQNVNFKRALEGELTMSIESLQGIQTARVHLVLPKPSIFQKLAAEPSASVLLRLGRAARLGDQQILGIQSLVAGSVENLSSDNVTVIDHHGKVLSNGFKDDLVGRSEGQLALKKEAEQYLAEKAQSMLSEVLGPERVIVRVDATLNFEKIDRENETYDPNTTVVRSEEREEANDPEGGGTQESSVTNYEINHSVERIVGHTGGIKQLSVAVFVDGNYVAPAPGEEPVYTPLTDDEMSQIKRIVQTAVGLSSVRGDQIEVVNFQFNKPQVRENGPFGGPMGGGWLEVIPEHGGRLLLFVLLAVLALSFRKNLQKLLGETLPAVTGGCDATGGGTANEEEERFEGMPMMTDRMLEDVQEYAAENPDRVAEVIQSWLYESDEWQPEDSRT